MFGVSSQQKICYKYKHSKNLDEFAIKKANKDGRALECKICKREYNKSNYLNNREFHINRIKIRQNKIKYWIQEQKLNKKCKYCPENHPACLQFHHRNRKEKEINISVVHVAGWSEDRIIEEINKCDLICANCHFKLHYNKKYGPKT